MSEETITPLLSNSAPHYYVFTEENPNFVATSPVEPIIEERKQVRSSSDFSAFVNIIKANVGAGILGMPYAFLHSGIWLGMIGTFILLLITIHCIVLLVQTKEHINSYESEVEANSAKEDKKKKARYVNTYGDIGHYAFGRMGTAFIEVILFFTQGGFCVAYLIFIGENMASIVKPMTFWHFILIAAAVLVPICCLRNIKYLSPFSLISELVLIVGMGVIFYYCFANMDSQSLSNTKGFNFVYLPIFFGIAVYSFEGIGLVLPIQGSMKNPSHFQPILFTAMGIIAIAMTLFGFLGYLGFGPFVRDVITLNLPDGIPSMIVKIGLVISLLFTYPIQMFPLTELFDNYMGRIKFKDPVKQGNYNKLKFHVGNLFRVFMIILTVLCAILGSDKFGYFLSLIGGFGGSLLAYSYPAAIHLKLFFKTQPFWVSIKDILIVVFGVLGGAICSGQSLENIIKAFTGG